jgi:Asp-tRNA(Asn)/Glu-tRNA(Gln) amidotransferase A subunit family amidase
VHQPDPYGARRGRRPVAHAELAQHVLDVAAHRPLAHPQRPGGHPVRRPTRQRREHLQLAQGQAGRGSDGPDYSDPLLGLGIEFAVARTVRDVAGLLDAVHGSEPGDRYVLLPPATTFLDAARRVFNATTRAVAGFFTEHDLLLTPTAAAPNTAIGHLDANDTSLDARGWYDRIFTFAACTSLSNVTGAPAISVPGPPSPEGWPVGVQLVGRHGAEETLLGVAALLEQALPWSGRRPAVVAS